MEKVKVIQHRLQTAQSRHKSYVDVRRRGLELSIGDWVFFKVSRMKEVMRFDKKGKISHQYVGPYVSRPKTRREWHPHLPSYVSEPTNLNPIISNIMNKIQCGRLKTH